MSPGDTVLMDIFSLAVMVMWLCEGSIFQPRTSRTDAADGFVEGKQSCVCSMQSELTSLVS